MTARYEMARLQKLIHFVLGFRSRRRELLRGLYFDVAARFGRTLSVNGEAGRFYVSTRDKAIGRSLFIHGVYEDLDTLRQVNSLLTTRNGDFQFSGKTFVEVGANIGTATIAAVNVLKAGRALAIEPGPENFKLLNQNIAANGLQQRVHAVQAAASSESGSITLAINEENWGDNRIGSRVSDTKLATVEVEALTLDEAVEREGVDPADVALIWIDAQGHEPDVLAGATSLLNRGIPVVAEYWPFGFKPDGVELFERLVQQHFGSWADLKESAVAGRLVEHPASEISTLRTAYEGVSFTDLLLLK